MPSSLNDSFNNLSRSSSDVARIRRGAKGRPGAESAKNLLGSILDDTTEAAETERIVREENAKRAEEEAQRQKEMAEEDARLQAEREIIAEKQAQEDLKLHQAEMQAQLQREKDIEAGIINLEEEARQKREEEERKRAKEEAIKRKTEAKLQAIEFKKNQETELEALRQEQLAKEAQPKKSNLPKIIAAAAAVVIAGVVALVFALNQEVIDPYAMGDEKSYETQSITFVNEDNGMMNMARNLVVQAPPPKPVAKKSGGGKKKGGAAAPAAPMPKPSLTGGKGGLFGKGKL